MSADPGSSDRSLLGDSRACFLASPRPSLKWSSYFAVYDEVFARLVDRSPTIVEVGVYDGGSLFMWRSFFGEGARIIGVDNNPAARALEDEGFEIVIGDQASPAFWREFFAQVEDVDILLDDGGHMNPQQIVTAACGLRGVRDGGLIVVEDTHTSYMRDFGNPSRSSFISYTGRLIEALNARNPLTSARSLPAADRLASIRVFESMVVLEIDSQRAHPPQEVRHLSAQSAAADYRRHGIGRLKLTADRLRERAAAAGDGTASGRALAKAADAADSLATRLYNRRARRWFHR